MKPIERRISALEERTPDHQNLPWVELIWERGEPRPVVPEGFNGIIRRMVAPGDPPEWLNLQPGEA